MDWLPDRPLTWQEVTLVTVLSVIFPGAGLFLAGTALAITLRADQLWSSVVLAVAAVWSVAFLIVLLTL
jgi:hypothetical protein